MVFLVCGFRWKHWLFSLLSSMYLKLASFKLILVGNWEDSDLEIINVQSSLGIHGVPVPGPTHIPKSKDAQVPFSQLFMSTGSTSAHTEGWLYIYWKNPRITGPVQLKPVLFKGQLYELKGNRKINFQQCIVGLLYPWVLHLQIESTNCKAKIFRKKIPGSSIK